MASYKTAAELPQSSRENLRHLLIAIADTKMLMGYHYGEWTFGAPALEASIAACSMSQDEFGHLRLFHGCLTAQYDEDADSLLEERSLDSFANIPSLDHPLKSWSDFAAVNLMSDGIVTVILKALRESSFTPVASFVDKMIEEEKHHIRNGQGWFRTIAARDEKTRNALADACQRVFLATMEWVGPDDHQMGQNLHESGILQDTWQQVTSHFLDWICPFAKEHGIELPVTRTNGGWQHQEKIDYSQWNPQTRRCRATHPDEELLYHLRGSKNAIFKNA